jgi:hypothetical protein
MQPTLMRKARLSLCFQQLMGNLDTLLIWKVTARCSSSPRKSWSFTTDHQAAASLLARIALGGAAAKHSRRPLIARYAGRRLGQPIRPTALDDRVSAPSRNAITSLTLPAEQKRLAFEHYPDEIAIAPDQPTSSYRAEVVERYVKLERHDVQTIANACPEVGYVANATCMHPLATGEMH